MSESVELCVLCATPTKKGGKNENASLYVARDTPAEIGPLCVACLSEIQKSVVG